MTLKEEIRSFYGELEREDSMPNDLLDVAIGIIVRLEKEYNEKVGTDVFLGNTLRLIQDYNDDPYSTETKLALEILKAHSAYEFIKMANK